MAITNNLFPPIMSTFMPAFIYTNNCRIYFNISQYNTISNSSGDSIIDKNKVQVTVRRQVNNRSALKEQLYPNEIKICTLFEDNNRETDDKYYIEISPTDLSNGFNLNEYYKVQIRFTSTMASSVPTSGGIGAWLSSNLSYFSEWSSVTLIYGISMPNISLNSFIENSNVIFDIQDFSIQGYYYFANSSDKESIKSYKIQIFKTTDTQHPIESSQDIYINSYNNVKQIYYQPKYNFKQNENYFLSIQIITNNLYSWDEPKKYYFKVTPKEQPQFDVDISMSQDNQNGALKILIQSKYVQPKTAYTYEENVEKVTGKSLYLTLTNISGSFNSATILTNNDTLVLYNEANLYHDLSLGTQFYIRRSSSKTNFNIWRQVDVVTIKENNISKMVWLDCTVQPGVWYKYYIIRYNSVGQRVSSLLLNQPKMVVTDDIFLTGENKQLRIRFDPQISNFSIRTSESLIETIGSRYPFIRRNANTYYKTFSLSGTITHFMDSKSNLFQASKEDIYQDNYSLYKNYNEQNNITPFNDYIYEKNFRQKVIQFLYDNNVKLFRSLTEGNMFIKLMNISLTPNITLGRMIYSFSCTVCEIQEDNDSQYEYYNPSYKIVTTVER